MFSYGLTAHNIRYGILNQNNINNLAQESYHYEITFDEPYIGLEILPDPIGIGAIVGDRKTNFTKRMVIFLNFFVCLFFFQKL